MRIQKLNRPHRELLHKIAIGDLDGISEEDVNYVVDAARGVARARFLRHNVGMLSAPAQVEAFLRDWLRGLEHEVFGMILMDHRHRVITVTDLFRGTVDGASVHTREVVKELLMRNASAVILYHNHPSGVAEPSRADIRITARLRDALATIDARILDHIIVGDKEITSLAERGLI